MKRSIYDLSIKIQGKHDNYTVRRRVLDGGFECSCPAWNLGRKECYHVRDVRTAVAPLTRSDSLESLIESTVHNFPFYIPNEDRLITRLVEALRSFGK